MKTGFRNENKRDYRVSGALLTCQTRRFIRLTCLKSAKDIIQPCEIPSSGSAREGTRAGDKFIYPRLSLSKPINRNVLRVHPPFYWHCFANGRSTVVQVSFNNVAIRLPRGNELYDARVMYGKQSGGIVTRLECFIATVSFGI